MKKVALLIYPEFSIQEVSILMYIFRWFYECKTVTFSSSKDIVYSEEGIAIVPEKTFDEFHMEEYHCLIVSGCSDFTKVMEDKEVFRFLHSFQNETEFIIGAICGGPMLLSMAGLLDEKKYTNSLPYEINVEFSAIHYENHICAPVVVDQNIVTAWGDAYRKFAIEIARKVGFTCRDEALAGVGDDWEKGDGIHHIPQEELNDFYKQELPLFEKKYSEIINSFIR